MKTQNTVYCPLIKYYNGMLDEFSMISNVEPWNPRKGAAT